MSLQLCLTKYTSQVNNACLIFKLFMTIKSTEVISAPDVSGYLQTGEVTLTCELHGYQSSFSPPVWLNSEGVGISSSDKYTISYRDAENMIVLEDGTTLPSVVVSLTIHNLTSTDEGNYTCRGIRGDRVSQLTLISTTSSTPLTQPTTRALVVQQGIA